MKPYLIFILHLVSGTAATFLTAIEARSLMVRLVSSTSGTRPSVNFDVHSFALAFVPIGLIAGYMVYARFNGKSALYVFLIPPSVLMIRILTFPAPSVFSSGIASGWEFFFGKAVCSAPDLSGFYSSASQCVSRMLYLGMCYSALGYSVGALLKHVRFFEIDRKNADVPKQS